MWTLVKARLIQVEELEDKTDLAFSQETVKNELSFYGSRTGIYLLGNLVELLGSILQEWNQLKIFDGWVI